MPAPRPLDRLPDGAAFAAIELALAGAGLAAARLIYGPFTGLRADIDLRSTALAAALSLPLLAFAALAASRRGVALPGLRRIYHDLKDSPIGDYIRRGTWPSFLLLSLCAGGMEELLFRAVLQTHWGIWLTALAFGLFHALSPAYFAAATLIGLYLGWTFPFADGNLYVPALIHALYDFIVLLLYRRRMRAESG
ncbi:MAG: CPBP family intramembrane glutamic endopeptidase [Elusimicrobiota bacterium]